MTEWRLVDSIKIYVIKASIPNSKGTAKNSHGFKKPATSITHTSKLRIYHGIKLHLTISVVSTGLDTPFAKFSKAKIKDITHTGIIANKAINPTSINASIVSKEMFGIRASIIAK